MPELAEVEFYRRRWHEAGIGQIIREVEVHPGRRVFRDVPAQELARRLRGARLIDSAAAGKQMVFRLQPAAWLGVHLGMSGELSVGPAEAEPGPHDHLVLRLRRCALVYTDPRMFGAIRFHKGADVPTWWSRIAPPILSRSFSAAAMNVFLARRARSPIKAVLLMQERFPGIGNWMADEALWRAGIHPARRAGDLGPDERQRLWRRLREVARDALRCIAGSDGTLPPDLNVHIPTTWLFHHRWRDGGHCPRTGVLLQRAEIGGRTTCWSPARQPLKP